MKIYSDLLIFSVQTNVSKCNKKPTGNIYYILTEFEEKNKSGTINATNVAYSNSQSNIQNHVIISLSLSDCFQISDSAKEN